MKNLNLYGEDFINEILNFGRLEDENIYKEINNVSVTESTTNYLINLIIKKAGANCTCFFYLCLICGKNKISRIEVESVKNIIKRSTPIPNPPVGGNPNSKAVTKSSSIM